MSRFPLLLLVLCLAWPPLAQGSASHDAPAYHEWADGRTQYATFPIPAERYEQNPDGLGAILMERIHADPFNLAATIIFALAILHTFSAGFFVRLSRHYEKQQEEKLKKRGLRDTAHPGGVAEVSFRGTLFHFLGEIEAVFGIWVIALAGCAAWFHSWDDFRLYLNKDRNFTEALFVVVIMAIAASRPLMRFAEHLMAKAAAFGKDSPTAWWFSVLTIAPLLGSFITEPAAMTIAAVLLGKRFYRHSPPPALAYATLGLLFVNISIGGTLTNFAAPPILMVAGPWEWSTIDMLRMFGWKSVTAILLSTGLYFLLFRKTLSLVSDAADGTIDDRYNPASWQDRDTPVPTWITIVHLAFLLWTVSASHDPVLFVGGFLFFLAFIMATRHHQNDVALRGPIMVGFFLGGLVIHGGCQSWWIEPLIHELSSRSLMIGAALLTTFNDNAAITYLAAQVPDIGDGAKIAIVAGAITGGGMTVIANAPNPAGQNILAKHFKGFVSPLGLAMGAFAPTMVAYLCFSLLPTPKSTEAPDAKASVRSFPPSHPFSCSPDSSKR